MLVLTSGDNVDPLPTVKTGSELAAILPCHARLLDLLCLYGEIVGLVVVVYLSRLSILSSPSSSVLPLLTTACLVCPVRSKQSMRSPVPLFSSIHSSALSSLPSLPWAQLVSTNNVQKVAPVSTTQPNQPTDQENEITLLGRRSHLSLPQLEGHPIPRQHPLLRIFQVCKECSHGW